MGTLTVGRTVVDLAEVDPTRPDLVGGKAAGLASLVRGGERVPSGFCITAPTQADAVDDAVRREIVEAYRRLGAGPVAVRSSATAEDLPHASFAGQHETVLDVRGADALIDAVERCWASLSSDRAVAYREATPVGGPVAMGVVVQRMVEPSAAGVLFTANPITGCRTEMVVDAVPGLGDAVVDGSVTADHYVLPQGRPVEGSGGCLDPHRLAELRAAGERLQRLTGAPQDIEWAFDRDGLLWLLQSRAITTLFPLPRDAPPRRPRLSRGRAHAGHAAAVHADGHVRDAGRDGAVPGERRRPERPLRPPPDRRRGRTHVPRHDRCGPLWPRPGQAPRRHVDLRATRDRGPRARARGPPFRAGAGPALPVALGGPGRRPGGAGPARRAGRGPRSAGSGPGPGDARGRAGPARQPAAGGPHRRRRPRAVRDGGPGRLHARRDGRDARADLRDAGLPISGAGAARGRGHRERGRRDPAGDAPQRHHRDGPGAVAALRARTRAPRPAARDPARRARHPLPRGGAARSRARGVPGPVRPPQCGRDRRRRAALERGPGARVRRARELPAPHRSRPGTGPALRRRVPRGGGEDRRTGAPGPPHPPGPGRRLPRFSSTGPVLSPGCANCPSSRGSTPSPRCAASSSRWGRNSTRTGCWTGQTTSCSSISGRPSTPSPAST